MRCVFILCALIAWVSATSPTSDDAEPAARLLVSKQIHNKFLVESVDMVVKYTVYNVGNSAAVNVRLVDASFPPEDFEFTGGQMQIKIDRIPPGANVTHTVVVQARKFGLFNFTTAEVRYLPSEDSSQVQIGYSSEPGEGYIVSYKEYDRKFSPHMMDWLAFAVMTLPSLGIPFLLWQSSKSKYENLLRQKREKGKEKDRHKSD